MGNSKDNNIVYINLSDKKILWNSISSELRKKYIGGAGINTKILYDSEAMCNDALSEKNVLIFGVGPSVGTGLFAGNRCTITAKSPLTDIYGDSNVGGNFTINMRAVNIDHLVFEGKAEAPVYVYINKEGNIQIMDATDLWGNTTDKTTKLLLERHGKGCEVACIGPAGENLVRFASVIVSESHAAGRMGMGCVMGSKNLKAIVIARKRCQPPIDNPNKIKEIKDIWVKACKSSMFAKNSSLNGTLFLVDLYNKQRLLPIENSQSGYDPRVENISLSKFKYEHQTKNKGCFACPIVCGKKFEIREGKYKGESGERIDYGAVTSVGPTVGIFDWPSIIHLKLLIDYLGIDAIELSGVIGLILECQQRGIVTKEDMQGREVRFGNADDVEYLIYKLSNREGIGDLLAEGTYKAAKELNAEDYAMCIKKSASGTQSNSRLAWSLGYITSTRGGDHLKNYPFTVMSRGLFTKLISKSLFNVETDAEVYGPDKKGRFVWWHENYKYVMDSLGLCLFAMHGISITRQGYFKDFAAVINGICNCDVEAEDVFLAAERIYQLQNAFNIGCGMELNDYKWPERKREEGINEEYIKLTTIKLRNHPGMLPEYFRFRGLNKEGKPSTKRFKELGMDEYIEKAKTVDDSDVECLENLLKEVSLTGEFSRIDKIKNTMTSRLFCRLSDLKEKKEGKEYLKRKKLTQELDNEIEVNYNN